MSAFDPSKTITLDQPPMLMPAELPRDWAQVAFKLVLCVVLLVMLGALALTGIAMLEVRGAHWSQSERNRYVAQMASAALERARDAAISSGTTAQWTQSALGRDDAPYIDGNVWSIQVANATVFGRSAINSNLGVRLHSPRALVRFDPRGHPEGGATRLTVDSAEPGNTFEIDISASGQVSTQQVGA